MQHFHPYSYRFDEERPGFAGVPFHKGAGCIVRALAGEVFTPPSVPWIYTIGTRSQMGAPGSINLHQYLMKYVYLPPLALGFGAYRILHNGIRHLPSTCSDCGASPAMWREVRVFEEEEPDTYYVDSAPMTGHLMEAHILQCKCSRELNTYCPVKVVKTLLGRWTLNSALQEDVGQWAQYWPCVSPRGKPLGRPVDSIQDMRKPGRAYLYTPLP